MKKAILMLVLFTGVQSQAWIVGNEHSKEYNFKFKMAGETFSYEQSSTSYEEAYESAAKACFDHFRGHKKVSMDAGMDIIDVCANPR